MSCTESDKNRLHRLVNNPYLADVKFLVGRKRKLIYGHRTLLTCASEVFQSMFGNKRFLKIHRYYPLVIVSDVEPDIFLDVLYYIYCDECDISEKNVAELFYASAKYQLYELQTKCVEFMIATTKVSEWLQIFFEETRNQRLRKVSEAQIESRAEEVLRHPSFLQLGSSQVKEILELKKLQCTNRQLLEAVDRWIEHQPESQRSEFDSLWLSLLLKIDSDKKNQVRSFEQELQPRISGAIVASRDVMLYGLGIYTGIDCSEVQECDVCVNIEIGCCEKDVVRESISLRIPDQKRITECLFNQLKLSEGDTMKFTVQISGMPTKLRQAWCADNRYRTPLNNQGDLRIVSSDNAHFVTPIAYLIYEPVNDSEFE